MTTLETCIVNGIADIITLNLGKRPLLKDEAGLWRLVMGRFDWIKYS